MSLLYKYTLLAHRSYYMCGFDPHICQKYKAYIHFNSLPSCITVCVNMLERVHTLIESCWTSSLLLSFMVLYVHRNVRLIRTWSPGRPPRLSHSSWALTGRSWWWCRASCPRMSDDKLGTNCDQCRSMVQCCFTSTETVKLIRTESPGRPPRLSHSSWTLTIGTTTLR